MVLAVALCSVGALFVVQIEFAEFPINAASEALALEGSRVTVPPGLEHEQVPQHGFSVRPSGLVLIP